MSILNCLISIGDTSLLYYFEILFHRSYGEFSANLPSRL